MIYRSPDVEDLPWHEGLSPKPLDPALAVKFNDIQVARRVLWISRRYSTPIESEVRASAQLANRLLHRTRRDRFCLWFNDVWLPEELAHGEGQRKQCRILNITQLEEKPSKTKPRHALLGWAVDQADTLHRSTKLAVLGHMLAGEQETIELYRREAGILTRNGEREAARYSGLTTAQEARHRDFQMREAQEVADSLPKRWVRLAGKATTASYTPVGIHAADQERMCAFGDLLRVATEDGGASIAQEVTQRLVAVIPTISPEDPFLLNQYKTCVALSVANTPTLVDDYYHQISA